MFSHLTTIYSDEGKDLRIYLVYSKEGSHYKICNYKGNIIYDEVGYRFIYANKIDIVNYAIEVLKKWR